MIIFTKTANDWAAPVDSAGNLRQIQPHDAQVWGTEVERVLQGVSAGVTIYDSKADMEADTSQAANAMAWVLGDDTAANNGIYQFDGTSTWTRLGDLPYSYIKATNAGAGTANAIQATTSVPVPAADGGALIALPIVADNTASPVTVSFNGGDALTIKTNSGNDISVGGLVSGMIIAGYVSGTTFRLLSDQASAAIVAQAEAEVVHVKEWATNPEDDPVSVAAGGDDATTFSALHWAAKAAASAAAVDLPSITVDDAGKLLAVKSDGSGYEVDDRIEAKPLYIGFYNGQGPNTTPASQYNIGVATAIDPKYFGRKGVLAPLSDDAAVFDDSSGHQCPTPIRVEDEIWVYYEGYDGTKKSIFLLTTDLHGNLRKKPLTYVIPYNLGGGETSVSRPAVIYEPDDATWPFKMAFCRAFSGTNPTSIVTARSADGVTWSVIGEINGIAGNAAWENTYLDTTGRLVKDGSTYRLFYGGHNGSYWQGGEMHSTDFATWTKHASNPLITPRGGYNVALTADVSGKTIKVTDSSIFDVGAPIALWTAGSPYETGVIADIPDGTTLQTRHTILGAWTTAIGSKVSQMHSRSLVPTEVWREGDLWKALVTCFQYTPGADHLIETVGYAEAPYDLSSPFTLDVAAWPLPLNEKLKTWDQVSAENLKFVRVQ